MRKHLLASLIILLANSLHAQFQKNSIYGNLSFGYRITGYDAVSSSTGLSLGLDEKNTIGFFLDRTRTRGRYTDLNGIRNNITSFGGGISFTHASFFSQKKKWGWVVNSTLSYSNNRLLNEQPTGSEILSSRNHTYTLGFSPGLIYKASDHFTFFAQVASFSVYKNNVNPSVHTELYPQLKLGVIVRLGSLSKKPH